MISPLAYIHPEAIIGENVEVGPFVLSLSTKMLLSATIT